MASPVSPHSRNGHDAPNKLKHSPLSVRHFRARGPVCLQSTGKLAVSAAVADRGWRIYYTAIEPGVAAYGAGAGLCLVAAQQGQPGTAQ